MFGEGLDLNAAGVRRLEAGLKGTKPSLLLEYLLVGTEGSICFNLTMQLNAQDKGL